MDMETRMKRLAEISQSFKERDEVLQANNGDIHHNGFVVYGALSICHRLEDGLVSLKHQFRNGALELATDTLMDIVRTAIRGMWELQKAASVQPMEIDNQLVDLLNLYEVKNTKYGNSFSNTVQEYGLMSICIRLGDKISRTKTLILNSQEGTSDESLVDTLRDIALYSLMSVMELDQEHLFGDTIKAPENTPKPQDESSANPVEEGKRKLTTKDREYWEKEFPDYTKEELFDIAEILKIETPPRKKTTKQELINLLLNVNPKKLEDAVNEHDSRS